MTLKARITTIRTRNSRVGGKLVWHLANLHLQEVGVVDGRQSKFIRMAHFRNKAIQIALLKIQKALRHNVKVKDLHVNTPFQ